MAVSHLRNTPITGKSYTTPVDATAVAGWRNGCTGVQILKMVVFESLTKPIEDRRHGSAAPIGDI